MNETSLAPSEVQLAKRQSTLPRRSIDSLTGIRFFAAAWVVLFHFRGHMESMFPAWRAFRPLTESGYLGVDLFFILSGFIIAYTYLEKLRFLRKREYGRFLGMRLARMYPVHLVTLGALLFMAVGAHFFHISSNHNNSVGDFIRSALLLTAWTPGQAALTWNYPAWSISAEWFAYLLFPLLAVPMARVRTARASTIGVLVALSAYMVLAVHIQSPLLRIACEFTAGVFLARLFAATSPGLIWKYSTLFSLACVPLIILNVSGLAEQRLLIVAFAMLIIGLAHSVDGPATFLSRRKIVFLGEISYSLYMTHGIIEQVSLKFFSLESHSTASLVLRLLILASYVVAILGTATAMFVFVERPARDRLRSLI